MNINPLIKIIDKLKDNIYPLITSLLWFNVCESYKLRVKSVDLLETSELKGTSYTVNKE